MEPLAESMSTNLALPPGFSLFNKLYSSCITWSNKPPGATPSACLSSLPTELSPSLRSTLPCHGLVGRKATLAKTLAWPADDPDLTRQGRKQQGWSVLDDQILFWRAFSSSENPRTVIYMANTKSARDTQSETVSLERIAELDYAAHRLAIVPDVGFVTAQWRFVYPVRIVICRTESLA